MSDLIILSGEHNESINDLILELSNLIKTEKFQVIDYLELIPSKLKNRKSQFYKDIIIFGNEDIQLNNFGRITSNLGSFRINNTNLYVRQNLNVDDTIFIDYIGNSSDTDYGLYVKGGLISNITKVQNLILHDDITLGGNLNINGQLLNYGNTYISNSLYVNGNITVGPNNLLKNIIFTNVTIFGNNQINYPLFGNIIGNILNVSDIYSNNIFCNIIDNANSIIANQLISNMIFTDIYTVEELFNSYLNIGSGNIDTIISVSNIYVTETIKTNKLQAIDLNISGNISKLNISNPTDNFITNNVNTNISTITDIYTSNLSANNIYVSGTININSLNVSNISINKLNIINLFSSNTININGLNVSQNCIITGNNIFNNVDGVTVGENIITLNSLNKLADTGIAFSYSDKYIGYIYKHFKSNIIDENSFVFAKINSSNVDNNESIIDIKSLLPIYVKQIEGNIQTGLYIGNKGNVIIYSNNIFINDNFNNYNYLTANNIFANNILINNNITSNNIYGNVYNITSIDNQNNVLISNLDQVNSNIVISNTIIATYANIHNITANILNYNIINNGANINSNSIYSNTTVIYGNISTNNIIVSGNISANTIFIENISLYTNISIDFISTNKTLIKDLNIFTATDITCNIVVPSKKSINNTYFYQNNDNFKYLLYDNQFNGNVYISCPRGKINLNKEDNNRKLYFNNEQWVDLDNKSFYADSEYTILKGNTNNNYGQGMSCKLNCNGKYLFIGGPNYITGNIWLFERNITANNISNMNWSEITNIYTNFNSSYHPPNSNIYYLGESIDCSADGKILIASAKKSQINGILNVGAVCVFENINGSWNSNIIFNTSSLYFGNSIAITPTGSKILIGRTTDNSYTGNVFLYNKPSNGWINGPYSYINLTGTGITTNSLFGSKVKFGGENIICIGGNEKVWLYKYDGFNWNEFQYLINTSSKTGFGSYGIEFSNNTDILCIAAPIGSKGIIFIYKYFGCTYRLIQSIDFSTAIENIFDAGYQGFSLSLSGDARTIYIGSPFPLVGQSNINLANHGIYVYRLFNNKWVCIKEMAYFGSNYYIGYSMSTTSDGSILAVGGPGSLDFFGNPYIGIGSVGIYY